MTTTIIDYGMGNLRSVQKAVQRLGHEAVITRDPERIAAAGRVILPGVGAFTDGMAEIRRLGQEQAIRDFIATGKPYLGICMGMEFLLDESEEDAPNRGFGLVPGKCLRFCEQPSPDAPRLKVPHMGWNRIDHTARPGNPLFRGIEPDAHVYFVHSYHCVPADASVIAATCDYGRAFCASIWRDNLWATQFHPEKSQGVGLRILGNFLKVG